MTETNPTLPSQPESTAGEVVKRLDELKKLAEAASLYAPGEWDATAPSGSTWIDAPHAAKGPMHVADVRGWGHLTGRGSGALGLPHDKAMAIQAAIGKHIAAANPATVLYLLALIDAQSRAIEAARKVIMPVSKDLDPELGDRLGIAMTRANPPNLKPACTLGDLRAAAAAIAALPKGVA